MRLLNDEEMRKAVKGLPYADLFDPQTAKNQAIIKAQKGLSDGEWVEELIPQLIEKIKGKMWNDDWGVKGVIYPDMLDELVKKFLKKVVGE